MTKEDAQSLKAGKPDATIHYFKRMNHVLKDVSDNLKDNLASYSDPSLPLDSGLVEELVKFIK